MLLGFIKKSNVWGEFTKNTHIRVELPKRRVWTVFEFKEEEEELDKKEDVGVFQEY